MGNRKERRHSAKTAANRRVKLDLLAEPSGDFGDSSNHEEVGVGSNGKNDAGSPNSPSSSGQNPENPLLLLGQYSDEEAEETSKEINQGSREKTPTLLDEKQVKLGNQIEDENHSTETLDQENKVPSSSTDDVLNLDKNTVVEDKNPVPPHGVVEAPDQASVFLTSDLQATGDVDSGWKMVLHEESNSYYYWNVVTGETSWEVPAALTQGNESAYDPKSDLNIEETHATPVATEPNDVSTIATVFESKQIGMDTITNGKDEGFASQACDALSNVESYGNDSVIRDMSGHVFMGTGGESSDSYRLLQLGENLSGRLKSLKGSEQFGDRISKLSFELDIRLADIKSLVPYGSSLLPFWLHSENQLKNLEASINDEVIKYSQLMNTCEVNEVNDSEDRFQEHVCEAQEKADVGHHLVEDEDMDVEMEVEEDTATHSNDEHLNCGGSEPVSDVPPPPTDDWVPPPPPDEELLPPPPPDEPPEAAFPPPPSEMQTTQPYSYGEQYGFAYPGSGFEYYGQTSTEIPSNGYYVDANGSQIAAPLPTVYYPPVLNPEPVTYYTLQHTPSTTQVTSGIETSSVQNSVPETSNVTRDVSVVSAPAVVATESVPKVPPKVTRTKKRTVATVPSLRSNKKVSGLVDKWKAVKEELHEEDEEDEPENLLEVLEKKRQREIEQWHAQQLASGEAKDNANFQPLGGDWRERIRRKRAKKSTEVEENVANASDETKEQPDLADLSKQLPTGWQAYWDESSKQVYYGNAVTSETTWTKPTK